MSDVYRCKFTFVNITNHLQRKPEGGDNLVFTDVNSRKQNLDWQRGIRAMSESFRDTIH